MSCQMNAAQNNELGCEVQSRLLLHHHTTGSHQHEEEEEEEAV